MDEASEQSAPAIGPLGVAARVVVGLALIGLALFWRDPSWWDAGLGLIVFPAFVFALVALRARRSPAPLRAVGPSGHLLNAVVFVPLFLFPATAGAAFLFYGSSMLVAATRRSGGCEITAISNTLLDRDDQVGCMLFAPVDIAEDRLRRSTATSESG
ncbi:MAG: hypothetical protein ACRDMA_07090 [Solirubrobacterales bacterium]